MVRKRATRKVANIPAMRTERWERRVAFHWDRILAP